MSGQNITSLFSNGVTVTLSVALLLAGTCQGTYAASAGADTTTVPNLAVPSLAPTPASVAPTAAPTSTTTAPTSNMITPPTSDQAPDTTTANGSNKNRKDPFVVPIKGIDLTMPPPAPTSGDVTSNAIDAATAATSLEDQAKHAEAEAEEAKRRREEEHNIKSFDRAESGMFPLTDEQIRAFMHKVEDTQAAALAPSSGPPQGQVRIITMQLDPGVSPPVINLASNYVTTIDILDSTGAPWPILDVGIGGNFEVSPTTSGSHVVRIMPLTRAGNGNLSILMKDLPTPLIFRLAAGGPTVDMRAEVRITKFGPNAKIPLVSRPPQLEAGDDIILGILQNNPPSDAKRLKVSGLDARTMAWAFADRTYVRTPLTLLSPAWGASVSSGDGMTVYEIGDAPVLLMSENGAIVRAHVSRDDDHDK